MNETAVNLHMSRKRTLFLIASFSLVSLVLSLFVALSIKPNLMQLNSLLHSDYLYSATVSEVAMPDAYFQYNAGIGFTNSADARTGINADVVMQTGESEYTETVFWNADKMSENEVAISESLAKAYGLKVGRLIYSKHIVDGTIHEYVIDQILPDVTSIRVQGGQTYSEGIIVMGFDPSYAENVTHDTLLFTSEDINVLSNVASGSLSNIIYREDETKNVCTEMSPYYLLMVVLSIALIIGLITMLKKSVAYNFKRLITLGFYQKGLNRALFSLMIGTGIISICISFLIALAVFGIVGGINVVVLVLLLSIVIVECITLLIGEAFVKRKLWRQ